MRFTRNFVQELRALVKDYNQLGPRFDEFLGTLQTGLDIGRGTRYIGIGGQMHTQYGPGGARRAVGYLYGLGAASGALAELETRNRHQWDRFFTAVDKARFDLGQEEFDTWTQTGRECAEKFRTD